MNGDKAMENISSALITVNIVFGILFLLVWAGYIYIDKISDGALISIVIAAFALFIGFLCFAMWKIDKGLSLLAIEMFLGVFAINLYNHFLTRKQMKMKENQNGCTKVELEKLDRRIKASEFVIDRAWVIGIAVMFLYFVLC